MVCSAVRAVPKGVNMPTYEYLCTSCKSPLEVVQSIHEPSLTACPACGDGRLRKVFGNVGVVFKGSGFYRTDSRSKSTAAGTATARTEAKESQGSNESTKASESTKSSEAGGTGGASGGTSGAGNGSKGSKDSKASPQKAAAAAS